MKWLPCKRVLITVRDDRSGVAVIEWAIILVPLLGIVLGGIELGYHSFVRSQLNGSLAQVSRMAATESPHFTASGNTVEEKIEAELKQRINIVARGAEYAITQKSYRQFSGVGKSEKLITDKNSNGRYDSGDCWEDADGDGKFDLDSGKDIHGGANDVVVYDVTLKMPWLLPVNKILGLGDTYDIRATTAVRTQPYSTAAKPATICE